MEVIIIIKVNVNSEIKSNYGGKYLKVNKSQIARELGVDPRTVGKYLNGYVKPTIKIILSKYSFKILEEDLISYL